MQKSIKFRHGFILIAAALITVLVFQFAAADTEAETAVSASLPNFVGPTVLTNGSTEAVLPAIASSPVGSKVIVAYGLEDAAVGVNHDPYVMRSPDYGATWSIIPQNIYPASTLDSTDIDITYDLLTNRAHAIFVEGSTQLLYFREKSNETWPASPTKSIDYSGYTVEEISNPRIFSSGSQTLDIVWRERNGSGFPSNVTGDIYHARSTNRGTTWTIPLNPIIARTEEAFLPDLYVDGNTIHVVWQEFRGATPSYNQQVVYAVSKNGGSTWSSIPVDLSDLPGDSNPPDTAWAPRITVSDNIIHVSFTEKKLVGNSPDNDQQYIHHVSCPLSADCTKNFNWTSDGVISGQRLGANGSSPDVVQSTVAIQSGCYLIYFHGVEFQSTADNELVWGNANCGEASWSSPSKLLQTNTQLLRPDIAVQHDAFVYLVYEEKTSEGGTSQIRFMRSQPIIYLPFVVK